MARAIGGRDGYPLCSLFERGTAAGCDDAQLLDRFAADGQDEAAFAALVARHGPMVLATARAVSRHEQDAEDAFQATFLTLARRAGSVRGGASLAAWLHRVAYRSAVEASRATRRRRQEEARAGQLGATARAAAPSAEPDLAATVRAEVARLPEVNRLPVLLCDLEGLTYLEAAARLGWTEPTVRNRLAQARARLKTRLARRGLADLAAPLAWGGAPARAVVSAPLLRTTLAVVLGRTTASTPVLSIAQALAQGTIAMHLSKLVAAALLAASIIGVVSHATTPNPGTEALAPPPRSFSPAPTGQVAPQPAADAVVRGRVIDPTGQPVAGALVRTNLNFNHPGPPTPVTTGPDGGFTLPVPAKFRQAEPMAGFRGVIATAPGFGPGWTVDTLRPDVVIRLVSPGLPIEGRIVDEAKRPIAGASVRVESEAAPVVPGKQTESGSLDGYLALPNPSNFGEGLYFIQPNPTSTTTDADGWFRLTNLGAERLVKLVVKAPVVETTTVFTMTRGGLGTGVIRRDLVWSKASLINPSRFEQTVPPTRPITGTVRAAATGLSLAGWKVQGTPSESPDATVMNQNEVVTDAAGRYTLTGLARVTKYDIYLAPPAGQPYLPAGLRGLPALASAPIVADHAARPGVVVRGRVTDKRTGAPLAGYLNAEAFRSNPHVREFAGYAESDLVYRYTDADGRYEVVVPPGPSVVAFRAADEGRYRSGQGAEGIAGYDPQLRWFPTVGRETAPGSFHVLAGVNPVEGTGAITLDLAADPDGTVDLIVLDPAGKPVTGVEVEGLQDFIGQVAQWQDSSPVVLQAFPLGSVRRVTVRHPGRKLVGSAIIHAADGSPQTLKLVPWGEIQGRIVEDNGAPRRDLVLINGPQNPSQPRPEPIGRFPDRMGVQGVPTDPAARFHLTGLVPGDHYGATAKQYDESLVGDLFDDVTVQPGQVKNLGDLKPRPVFYRGPQFKVNR